MNTAIDRQIQQIYKKVYAQVFNQPRTTQLLRGNSQAVNAALDFLTLSEQYDEFARKFAKELAKKGLRGKTGEWRRYYQAAKSKSFIGIPHTLSQYEANVMTRAIEENFQMIKSIPVRMKEIMQHKYTSTLIEEVAKGTLGRGSFEKLLARHGNKQAKLIARTETAKLQTAILEERSTQIGSVAYEWRASHDKRTRPSHREMDGVIVFWKHEKPLRDGMRGGAGEFPNCRCTPQPILDEDDLTESYYKVYDYRTDKIIRLSKKELITALRRNSL